MNAAPSGEMTAGGLSCSGKAVGDGITLGLACLVSYWLITRILGRFYFLSRDDELLGGMWAVIATIFVYRQSYQKSVNAALSRMASTLLSFVLCLVYLLMLPFHPWGMTALIAIGSTVMAVIGRSEDIITTAITTSVVMVVAAISPQHAWKVPILRLIETAVGAAVGIVGGQIGVYLAGFTREPALWKEGSGRRRKPSDRPGVG